MDLDMDGAKIPGKGHFWYHGAGTVDDSGLPTYNSGISGREPLTLTDCHLAMQSIMIKARLIGFEIARHSRSFTERRASRKWIVLQGDSREFDKILLSMKERFSRILSVTPIEDFTIIRRWDAC